MKPKTGKRKGKKVTTRYHDWGTGAQPGFHVACHPSGVRTYHVEWRDEQGAKQAMKLGRVDEMSLGDAKAAARDARRRAHDGIDPRGKDSTNFEDVIAAWSKFKVERKGRVAESTEDIQQWVLNSCHAWHGRPVSQITRRQIEDRLEAKCDEGHKPAANALYRHLRSMFKWAYQHRNRTMLQTNPMLEIELPWDGAKPLDKPWYSGDAANDVLRAVWTYANAIAARKPDQAKFIKLAMLTGKRGRCVHEMRWEHIDSTGYWRMPSRSKGKRNSPIPLPALAQRILEPRQSSGRIMREFGRRWLMKQVRNVPDDFHWHGLRKIMATKLEDELNVSPWFARMVIDREVFDDVHATHYVKATRRDQMSEVLEKWAGYVEGLVSPAKGVAVLR